MDCKCGTFGIYSCGQAEDIEHPSTLELKQLILEGNRAITEKIDGVAITVVLIRQDMDKMGDRVGELGTGRMILKGLWGTFLTNSGPRFQTGRSGRQIMV
ncbi:hypothetical protein NDU88_008357 [Pleurodeles waltl]|uniref:Uncharacterized protein n=1 Tax=Pleurodeles waltl TaxID=8319 RepID=A0AAV7N8L6_PLEWA|nr:hypothetical protein NDU88_008357 [Pleurodeles waltl]